MSLKIDNKATEWQIALLDKLGYIGTGKYAADQISQDQAGHIIDELRDLNKQEDLAETDKYNHHDQYGYTEEELNDPFSEFNK